MDLRSRYLDGYENPTNEVETRRMDDCGVQLNFAELFRMIATGRKIGNLLFTRCRCRRTVPT